MYLMFGMRTDMAFSIGVLLRTLEKPTDDVSRLKRVFRYIKDIVHYGIA